MSEQNQLGFYADAGASSARRGCPTASIDVSRFRACGLLARGRGRGLFCRADGGRSSAQRPPALFMSAEGGQAPNTCS